MSVPCCSGDSSFGNSIINLAALFFHNGSNIVKNSPAASSAKHKPRIGQVRPRVESALLTVVWCKCEWHLHPSAYMKHSRITPNIWSNVCNESQNK
eukprot:1110127-Prorocentrum_lima.AAC.1